MKNSHLDPDDGYDQLAAPFFSRRIGLAQLVERVNNCLLQGNAVAAVRLLRRAVSVCLAPREHITVIRDLATAFERAGCPHEAAMCFLGIANLHLRWASSMPHIPQSPGALEKFERKVVHEVMRFRSIASIVGKHVVLRSMLEIVCTEFPARRADSPIGARFGESQNAFPLINIQIFVPEEVF